MYPLKKPLKNYFIQGKIKKCDNKGFIFTQFRLKSCTICFQMRSMVRGQLSLPRFSLFFPFVSIPSSFRKLGTEPYSLLPSDC